MSLPRPIRTYHFHADLIWWDGLFDYGFPRFFSPVCGSGDEQFCQFWIPILLNSILFYLHTDFRTGFKGFSCQSKIEQSKITTVYPCTVVITLSTSTKNRADKRQVVFCKTIARQDPREVFLQFRCFKRIFKMCSLWLKNRFLLEVNLNWHWQKTLNIFCSSLALNDFVAETVKQKKPELSITPESW